MHQGTYSAELYGAAAVGFVEKHAAQYPTTPMYLQVEYFVPHAPTSPGPPTRYILPPFVRLKSIGLSVGHHLTAPDLSRSHNVAGGPPCVPV